jgi:hypothetical protein
MHIKYLINQNHSDKIKDYPHVDHKIKNTITFYTINLVYGHLYFFVTRSKNCLFYLANTHKTFTFKSKIK